MTEENNNIENSPPKADSPLAEKLEIENLRQQSEEYLAGWKRAKADYLNLKKEMEAQNKEIREWLSKIFLLPILNIMDSFDRAGTLDVGIENIKKQFEDFLKVQGVEAMKVIGEKFDPSRHEAVAAHEVGEPRPAAAGRESGESGTIAEESQKGYLMNGEILRPAKVKIYK